MCGAREKKENDDRGYKTRLVHSRAPPRGPARVPPPRPTAPTPHHAARRPPGRPCGARGGGAFFFSFRVVSRRRCMAAPAAPPPPAAATAPPTHATPFLTMSHRPPPAPPARTRCAAQVRGAGAGHAWQPMARSRGGRKCRAATGCLAAASPFCVRRVWTVQPRRWAGRAARTERAATPTARADPSPFTPAPPPPLLPPPAASTSTVPPLVVPWAAT